MIEYIGPGLIITYWLTQLWQLRPASSYLITSLLFMGIAFWIMRDLSIIRIFFVCIFMHLHKVALECHLDPPQKK